MSCVKMACDLGFPCKRRGQQYLIVSDAPPPGYRGPSLEAHPSSLISDAGGWMDMCATTRSAWPCAMDKCVFSCGLWNLPAPMPHGNTTRDPAMGT